jgi:NADH-quinone oxidoreductase subunit N
VIVVVLGLVLLVIDTLIGSKDKKWLVILSLLGLGGVFVMNFYAQGGAGGFWDYYTYGGTSFARFYKALALTATGFVLLMNLEYLPVARIYTAEGHTAGEFFVIPLFACAGMMWAASAADLVSVFVSIELITVSFYVLVPYMRRSSRSLEAGVKYLILGALSTGFMVYGIAWIAGMSGTTNLESLARMIHANASQQTGLLFGFALLLVALGFKVGAFPFCLWIPDVWVESCWVYCVAASARTFFPSTPD